MRETTPSARCNPSIRSAGRTRPSECFLRGSCPRSRASPCRRSARRSECHGCASVRPDRPVRCPNIASNGSTSSRKHTLAAVANAPRRGCNRTKPVCNRVRRRTGTSPAALRRGAGPPIRPMPNCRAAAGGVCCRRPRPSRRAKECPFRAVRRVCSRWRGRACGRFQAGWPCRRRRAARCVPYRRAGTGLAGFRVRNGLFSGNGA